MTIISPYPMASPNLFTLSTFFSCSVILLPLYCLFWHPILQALYGHEIMLRLLHPVQNLCKFGAVWLVHESILNFVLSISGFSLPIKQPMPGRLFRHPAEHLPTSVPLPPRVHSVQSTRSAPRLS
jgi:hypothetical protein